MKLDLRTQKAELRRHYRGIRAELAGQPSSEIWTMLASLEEKLGLDLSRPILAFVGVGGELPTLGELERRRALGYPIYLPRCEGAKISDGIMEFYAFAGEAALVDGPYGLREPRPMQALAPNQAPVIWVPGLAFDRDGRRLGQGGGFYDRFLVRETVQGALRIGLCPDAAIHQDGALPVNDKDQRVHWLVTPTQVIKTSFG